MNPANCLNCGTTLVNDQHFCAQCGQKTNTHRISLHEITHDAVHYFTHADKGIFHLVKALATRPGKVAQEYIAGKRVTYFKPLNFFLIVAGLVVFMTWTFHHENPRAQQNRSAQAAARPPTPEQIAMYKEMGKRAAKVGRITDKYSNIINILATPLFSAFFWLWYLRGRYNFLEHLVANMYFVPFVMLFYALVFVPLQSLGWTSNYVNGVIAVFFLFEITYRGIAYYQFIGKKGGLALFKAIGVSLLASAIWIAFSYTLIWYYIRYGF